MNGSTWMGLTGAVGHEVATGDTRAVPQDRRLHGLRREKGPSY